MRISRLIAVAALVGACCLAATASASAATTTCTGATGKIKLSPGLTATAAVQNVQIKGELTGCTTEGSEEVTSRKFQIHAKTAEISCSALTEGATSTEATLLVKSPGEGNSSGPGSVSLIEGAGAFSSTELTGGPFTSASGTLTESYTGGATCGQPIVTEKNGKKHEKPAKKVNKGTVTGGSAVLS